ncbi:unnamed protein product [Closterium sp. Yama58-4]|nr:unnamed protein product [Closterium sp. Yama58-4]
MPHLSQPTSPLNGTSGITTRVGETHSNYRHLLTSTPFRLLADRRSICNVASRLRLSSFLRQDAMVSIGSSWIPISSSEQRTANLQGGVNVPANSTWQVPPLSPPAVCCTKGLQQAQESGSMGAPWPAEAP